MNQIYLDHNASMPLNEVAYQAILSILKTPGNASSIHAHGRSLRQHFEKARHKIATLLDTSVDSVVFTGSGTESNTTILNFFKNNRRPIFVSAIEHHSIMNTVPNAIKIPVQPTGIIDLEILHQQLTRVQGQGAVVAVMLANNETGIVQPIEKITHLAHEVGAYVLCDAIQAVGKMPVACNKMKVDYLTASGHKFGGMQGCGIMIINHQAPFEALIVGGGQEKQRRGGTLNVAGALSFAVALEASKAYKWQSIEKLRNYLEHELATVSAQCLIVGSNTPRLPNTSLIRMVGVNAQVQLMTMDLAGISVSAGSACSSGTLKTSHVLQAMGYNSSQAQETIRISLGPQTTKEEIDQFIWVWKALYNRHNHNLITEM